MCSAQAALKSETPGEYSDQVSELMATEPSVSGAPVHHDRIPAVDACRGIATVLVLGFHADLLTPWAAVGMDLFFVISGFVITRRLLARYELGWFWWRRFRRLVPALLITILAVLAIGSTGVWGGAPVLRDAAAGLAYVANWVQIREGTQYWAALTDESPLKHLWSLAVEEQFYLVWPVVVVGLAILVRHNRRRHRIAIGVVAPALSIAAFLWASRLADTADLLQLTRVYEGTDARAGALLAGSGLAAWWRPPTRGLLRSGIFTAMAAALGVVLGLRYSDNAPNTLEFWSSPVAFGSAVASMLLVSAAAAPQVYQGWRATVLSPLRTLGTISYGAYLWHWPLMLLADEWGIHRALMLIPVVPLAMASHRLLEPPRLLERIPKSFGGRAAIIGTAACLATAGLLFTQVESAPDPAQEAAVPVIISAPPIPDTTENNPTDGVDGPSEPAKPQYAQVLILGDSVADSLIDEFASVMPPGVTLIDDAYPNCDGAEDADEWNDRAPPGCEAWRQRWAQLFPGDHPKTLAIWFAGTGVSGALTGQGGRAGHVGQPEWDQWWGGTVADRVRVLQGMGVDVALVLPQRPLHTEPVEFFFGSRDYDLLLARLDGTRSIMEQVSRDTDAPTVDLRAIICPDGFDACREKGDDGQVIRPDGIHFDEIHNSVRTDTGPRASWVAAEVLEQAIAAFDAKG